jgi:hypothetical protein
MLLPALSGVLAALRRIISRRVSLKVHLFILMLMVQSVIAIQGDLVVGEIEFDG